MGSWFDKKNTTNTPPSPVVTQSVLISYDKILELRFDETLGKLLANVTFIHENRIRQIYCDVIYEKIEHAYISYNIVDGSLHDRFIHLPIDNILVNHHKH